MYGGVHYLHDFYSGQQCASAGMTRMWDSQVGLHKVRCRRKGQPGTALPYPAYCCQLFHVERNFEDAILVHRLKACVK